MAATNTTTKHNSLIKDQVANMLVKPLESASVVLAAGPTIFDSSAPLRIPRLDSSGTVGFVGEGEKIPDTYTASFSEIALMPAERKSLKIITRVTNELIRESHMNVSAVLQQRIVEDVRMKLDDALLNGTGSNDEITGIFQQSGTQTATYDLKDPDTLLDALAKCTAKEVTPSEWMFNAVDFYELRKVKDKGGRYLLQPDLTKGAKFILFGLPVTVSNKVPTGKACLLNMREVAVVRDLDPTITILTEKYADTDETGIRVVTRYDLGLMRPEGVVLMSKAA